jgi:glutaconate CoA-transferase subunit B
MKEYKGNYSEQEYLSILISREVRNDDRSVGGGLNSDIVYNGVLLANVHHAPDIHYSTGGYYVNLVDWKLPRSTPTYVPWEYRIFHASEGLMCDHDEVLYNQGPRPANEVWFFAGLQIDKYGNINNSVIGDYRKPKVRSGGPHGQTSFTLCNKRYYIFSRNHTRRIFVEEVDFVTAMGYRNKYGTRSELGLDAHNSGPHRVITPLALMDFDEQTHAMRLKSVHPGHTLEEVVENTGFELVLPQTVPTTPVPAEDEITMLRNRVDVLGVLRKKWR